LRCGQTNKPAKIKANLKPIVEGRYKQTKVIGKVRHSVLFTGVSSYDIDLT